MVGASIETTLELWASSLRDVKARIRPLFTQERVAAWAGLFLDGVLARSHHAATMTASTHIRSGSIRPYHDPSFSRASGSGGMGSISLRRHVAATSVHDHHPPGSGGSVIRPIRGFANMSKSSYPSQRLEFSS